MNGSTGTGLAATRDVGVAVLRRLCTAAFTVVAAISLVFLALNSSGSPVGLLVGPQATAEEVATVKASLGLDRPLGIRFLLFLRSAATGSLPDSIQLSEPALPLVLDRLAASAALYATGFVLAVVLGLGLGYLAAVARPAFIRSGMLGFLSAVHAVPLYVVAIVLVYVFALKLRLLPTSGSGTVLHIVLPAMTLGLAVTPLVARVFRVEVLGSRNADYVLLARLAGASRARILLRHVIPNSLGPVVTVVGLQMAATIGGAVIIETAFSYPGVGLLAAKAMAAHDYPVIIAVVFVVSVAYVVLGVALDVVHGALDPRVRENIDG